MKIQPIASPTAIQQAPSNEASARARAVAAFQQSSQPTPQVVQNQNNVSPEELGAIQTQTRQPDTNSGTIQEDTAEIVTEVAAAPEAPKPAEDPALSRQFAQLARQEKALRAKAQQQEQTLRAREAAIQAREADLTAKDQTHKSGYLSRDTLKQDPLAALAEAGVSYEELTQQIISQQPVDPRLQNTINSLKQQIQELKQANEDSKKSHTDSQAQAYQAAVKQISVDAKNLVKSDPVAFEAISKTGTVREVVKLITETYAKDGVLLSVEEAAEQVENYLVEENYMMANTINKIKNRMNTVAPKASNPAQTPAAQTKQTQPMKTLTNATSSSRQLSAKERAILAFKGELKP